MQDVNGVAIRLEKLRGEVTAKARLELDPPGEQRSAEQRGVGVGPVQRDPAGFPEKEDFHLLHSGEAATIGAAAASSPPYRKIMEPPDPCKTTVRVRPGERS